MAKRKRSEKAKIADKLNKRLKRIKNTFGLDAVYQKIYKNVRTTENIILVEKSGNISAKNSETVLETLEGLVDTVTDIFSNTKDKYRSDKLYGLSVKNKTDQEKLYEEIIENEIKNMSEEALVNRANLYAYESSNYDDALEMFYNAKPEDIFSVSHQDFNDIQRSLKHPGRSLSSEEVNENTARIRRYLDSL